MPNLLLHYLILFLLSTFLIIKKDFQILREHSKVKASYALVALFHLKDGDKSYYFQNWKVG